MSDCCDNFEFFDDTDSFESWQGLVGPYYTPHLSAEGVLSWTNTGNLPNPAPVDISGSPGRDVQLRGPVATVYDLPVTAPASELWQVGTQAPYNGYFFNGTSWVNLGPVAAGPPGPAGEDGVSPEISVTDITGGHRVTITDATGTRSFDVMDGEDGGPGPAGADGVSPEVTIAQISGGHSVTITDADHPSGQVFDVLDGATGATGATGPQGPQGATGPQGPQGAAGPQGPRGAAGPGVPAGGSGGQVLRKQSATDYDAAWAPDPNANIGIVQNTNTATQNISEGQYVIWKGALYTASAAIASGDTLSSSNLTTVTGGGLNNLLLKGAAVRLRSSDSIDTIEGSGLFYGYGGDRVQNSPNNLSFGLVQIQRSDGTGVQIWIDNNNGFYFRLRFLAGWQPWRSISSSALQ